MLLPVTLPDSTAALLLLAGPDASPLQVSCMAKADQVTSLTAREERRPLAPGFTVAMKWKTVLPRTGGRAFRAGLLGLGRTEPGVDGTETALQPILCPFWPEVIPANGLVPLFRMGAVLRAVWEPDGTRAALYTDTWPGGYTLTAESLTGPVLQGRFKDWPEPEATTDELAELALEWIENGPLDRALQISAFGLGLPTGPTLHGTAWPLLPCAVRVASANAGGVEVRVARRQLGYGREEAETHHPQVPARTLELAHDLDALEAARLIYHWQLGGGGVSPFWAPAATSPCRLAAAATSAATTLTLDDADALLGHAHLWIGSPDGSWAARRITGMAGNVVTLDAALGFAAAPWHTVVQPLLFVRFARQELVLKHKSGVWAATCPLRELPAEYGTASGETLGTNHGPLAGLAWCYAITDGTETWRVTSYASALTLSGQTYTPARIEHGEMKERLNLDASECTVTLRDWPDSPFARYRLERAPAPLTLTIHEGVPSGGALTSAAPIWTGRVRSPKWAGPILTLAVGGFGTLLEQPTPRWLVQPTCSAALFDQSCGLNRATWTYTASRAVQAAGYTHALSGLSGIVTPVAAQWFAGGYVVRPRGAAAPQMISILASTSSLGGALTITLSAPLSPEPSATETWSLIPGCDGKAATCRDKFNNLAKHRGFPGLPTTNPSINIRRKTDTGAKK